LGGGIGPTMIDAPLLLTAVAGKNTY